MSEKDFKLSLTDRLKLFASTFVDQGKRQAMVTVDDALSTLGGMSRLAAIPASLAYTGDRTSAYQDPESVAYKLDTFGESAFDVAGDYTNRLSESLGFGEYDATREGRNPWEDVGSIIALGAFPISKVGKSVDVASQTLGNIARQGGVGTALAARLGQVGLRGVLDPLIPFTISNSPRWMAINTALPLAASELIRDVEELPTATGIDLFRSAEAQTAEDAKIPRKIESSNLLDYVEIVPNDPRLLDAVEVVDEQPWEPTLFDKVATGVATAAATGVAYIYGRRLLRRPDTYLRGETVDFGSNPETSLESRTTIGEALTAQVRDPDMLLASQFERAAGGGGGDFLARVEQGSRLGAATRTVHAMTTGWLPTEYNIRIPSIRVMQERMAHLTPQQQETFSRGMYAGTELDRRARAGGQRAAAEQYSDAELSQFYHAVRSDPKLAAMLEEYQQATHGLMQYMVREGVITESAAAEILGNNPRYMPLVKDPYQGHNILARKMEAYKDAANIALGRESVESKLITDMEHLLSRNLDEGTGLGRVLNPLDALEHYATGVMMYTQRNTVRSNFMRVLQTSPEFQNTLRRVKDPKNAGSVTQKAYPSAGNVDNIVSVRRDGKMEFYEFADPIVAEAVRLSPHATHGLLNTLAASRRIFQAGTTGIGQPFFALKALIYDTGVGAARRDVGTSFGLVDKALQRAGFEFGLPGDPTAYISAVLGTSRDVASRIAENAALGLMKRLQSSSPMWQGVEPLLGPIANRLWRSYIHSTRSIMQSQGVYNTGFLVDPRTSYNTLLSKLTPAYSAQNANIPVLTSIGSMYKGLLESIHNGARVAYFAQNYNPNMTPQQLRKLAHDTRSLAGDFSKIGLGKGTIGGVANVAAETGPYVNVAIQSTTKYFESLLGSQWNSVAVGTFNASVWPMLAGWIMAKELGPEYHDFLWNRMPAWQRATHAYFPIPGQPPEEGMLVPIAPELVAIANMTLAGFDEFTRVTTGEAISDPRINDDAWQDIRESFSALAGIMLPPTVNAALAIGGQKADLGNMFTQQDVMREINTSSIAGFDSDEAYIPNGEISANMREALISIFGTVAGFGMEAYTTAKQTEGGVRDVAGNIAADLEFEAARRTAPLRPIWGGHVETTMTPPAEKLAQKLEVLEKIIAQHNVDYQKVPGSSYLPFKREDTMRLARPSGNPEFAKYAGQLTILMQQGAVPYLIAQKSAIRKRIEALQSNRAADPREQTEQVNQLKLIHQGITDNLLRLIVNFEAANQVKLEDLDPGIE